MNELEPLIPITEARPLHEVWRASMAREHFILTLLTAFDLVALLFAAVGIYGATKRSSRAHASSTSASHSAPMSCD